MSDLDEIKIGKLTFRFNKADREITVDIPTADGIATLTSKLTDSNYEVTVKIGGDEKFSFKTDKMLTAIGSTNRDKYYKILKGNMEKSKIFPDYEGDEFNEKFNNFILNLQTADGHVIEAMKSPEKTVEQEKKVSWAEASGAIEKFPEAAYLEALEILKNGDLIDEILDVAELKAVSQRNNSALVTLIALSSFLEDSTHHIFTGPPGTSKSTITDTIFDLFPSQRKESIGKSSTPASLLNMTSYEEGSNVLSRKFIRIGDLGNEEEMRNALSLLSVFKEMMSEKKYDKTISVPEGDVHTTKRLTLTGLGSVHLSTIESNVESQYDSRSIISSPDDTAETAEKIKAYQLDDLDRLFKTKEYNRRRPVIAAAIELLCYNIGKLEARYGLLQFVNPYAYHMNQIFNIDASKNVNRDRNHIRDLPKSVTLSKIQNREIWVHEKDKDIKILITPEDYLYALKIIGKPILEMLLNISPQQQSYIRFISEKYLDDGDCLNDLEEYNEFALKESSFSDEGWLEKTTSDVCFTKKDITQGLGVSGSTASRILDDLVDKKIIYKRLIGRKNYYFPTLEFIHYSHNYAPEFYSDEELEVGGEVHRIAVEQYGIAVKRLQDAGYKKRKPPLQSRFG